MPLTVVTPAPFLDLVAMIAAENAPAKFSPQAIARVQGRLGLSWGYLDASKACVACAGLLPLGESDGVRQFEAWILARPAVARHMLSLVRWAQLTLDYLSQDGPIEARAYVDPPRDEKLSPGGKLVKAIGFVEDKMSGGGTWIYRA